jgi:hypothetical protein
LARPEWGIKRYAFGVEDEDVIGEDGEPRLLTREEKAALPPLSHRHGTSVGKCTFKTVKSLSWPPKLETQTTIVRSPSDGISSDLSEEACLMQLHITVSHDSPEPLTLQTSGQQHYLHSHSQRYGLLSDEMHWSRILHEGSPGLYHNIRIISLATNQVVFGGIPRQVCRLRDMRKPIDRRPRRESLTTIFPGQRLVRDVAIDAVLGKLEDGEYEVRLEPLRMWWCEGELGEDEDDSGRLPRRLWKQNVPPARLNAQPLQIRVAGGKLDWLDG